VAAVRCSGRRRRGGRVRVGGGGRLGSRSRHSRRTLPTQRSMWAFALGARTGVRMTLMLSVARRASKARGNFVSRSWIRNLTRWSRSSSSISRLRACCTIQAVSGRRVQARYSIRRLAIERKTSTYRRRSETVSTVKKSQAKIEPVCARRNARHDCRSRCGAGGRPALARTLRTEVPRGRSRACAARRRSERSPSRGSRGRAEESARAPRARSAVGPAAEADTSSGVRPARDVTVGASPGAPETCSKSGAAAPGSMLPA
jgi:hypothetical protein